MKIIREKMIPLLISITMVVGTLQGIGVTPVYAASTASVSIGNTSVSDGKYYTAINGEDPTMAVVEATDTAPADGTPYLYYKDDVLTVSGNISLNSNGPSTLAVSGGAITIAGSGSLSLSCSGAPVVDMYQKENSLILSDSVDFTVNQTGYAPGITQGNIQTLEGYSGDIILSAGNIAALLGMSTVDLQTTGDIDISSGGTAPVITSSGQVTLKGEIVNLQHTDNGILLQSTSASITAMEGGLSLKGNSNAPILQAPEGITLSAGGDIEIVNSNATAGIGVSGNLTVAKAKNVTIQSSSGLAVSGSTDITATGDVNISTGGNVPAIYSSSTIKIAAGSIQITGKGTVPVISAEILTLQAAGNILVQRTEDAGSLVPMIEVKEETKSLTSDHGLIIVSGSTGTTITAKDGSTVNATFGGDVSSSGLDLYGNKGEATPTKGTFYLAGNGYLLFTPAKDGNPATLLMNNASIEVKEKDATLITLPEGVLTIELVGENKLTAKSEETDGTAHGITLAKKYVASDLTITSSDSGTLNIDTSITSDGFGSIAMGDMESSFNSLNITGNASVTALSHIMNSSTGMVPSYGTIVCGNLTVGDDASFISKGDTCDVVFFGGTIKTKNFNGTVGIIDNTNYKLDFTVYGKDDLPDMFFKMYSVGTIPISADVTATVFLNITIGSTLTIPTGKSLTINDLSKLINNGNLINNGTVILPSGTTVQQIKALKLTGSGTVKVAKDANASTYDTYTNNGVTLNEVEGGNLDLTQTNDEVPASAKKGYTWTKSGEGTDEVWTLTLDNTYISGSLALPDKTIVIHSTANNIISGSITPGLSYPCHMTLSGPGSLTVGAGFSGGQGGDMTVAGGVDVTFNDSVFIGTSGGVGGTLNVTGTGTTMKVSSPFGYAISCDILNVKDKASLTTSAQGEGSRGVMALTGVTVTGGAYLTAGCDYGVYIIGGNLLVDEGSKLTTNGSVAPFCIVDKTSGKEQRDVLTLPAIPDGTEIASVKGSDTGYGCSSYWSIVPTGGSLSVTHENSEPVTLSGAVTKEISFYKAKTPSQPDSSGSTGNTTNGSTSGTITKVLQTDTDGLIVSLNNTVEELNNILFTSGELGEIKAGQDAKVLLFGTIGSVSENDKKLAQKKQNGENPDLYFDLSLYKQIGNGAQTRISNTDGKPLNISITVPEALRESDRYIERTYYLVSMYDGTANMVKGSYDSATHKLTFETDCISAFALGHKDSHADGIQTIANFNCLRLKAKATWHTQKLSYTKVSGADGYLIYGAQCGSGKKLKKLAEVSGNVTKYTDSNLKKATSYKYQVKAYKMINGKKEIIAISKIIYSITEGTVYSNPLKVKADLSKVTLNQGKTTPINGKVVLPKNKKMKHYTAVVQYESTDKAVATVSNKGVIRAVAKGTCYVYGYAQNGVYTKIKVTVK